tara:strand:- start:85 stop:378 length:294 start_codon:yes stop_codon:yes gene_type:complete
MLSKLKDIMGKKKKKKNKPQIKMEDDNGNVSSKNIEDLSVESKLAIARLDEIGREKTALEKRFKELGILEQYYTGQVGVDVKTPTPINGVETVEKGN